MSEVENVVSFIGAQFKRLNVRFDAFGDRVNERLDRSEARMDHLERRRTASMHFEQSVIANLIGINERLGDRRAGMLGFDRRLDVLEAR